MITFTKIKVHMKWARYQRRIEKAIDKMTKYKDNANDTKFNEWASKLVEIARKRDTMTLK